ncbi:MAG: ABC transporter permease, partial [Fidelibacterota bacterium]
RYKERKTTPTILLAGGTPEFQPNNGYFVGEGRFITDADVIRKRSVVVLGMDIVNELFPFQSPIGKEIKVGANKFEVIGIFEEQGNRFGQSQDNVAVIPITTFQKIYGKERSINITIQAKSPELYQTAVDQVIEILRIERKVPPGEANDFEIFSSNTLIQTFDNLTKYIRIAAVGIASISLLVAGIGIMNIMLVSVTERTREIGVRKAVGARQRDVLGQFLVEAVILSEVGGVIGVILGLGITKGISLASPLPTAIPFWSILLALGFCSIVGLFFGIYPAFKAARLDPIVALRYE